MHESASNLTALAPIKGLTVCLVVDFGSVHGVETVHPDLSFGRVGAVGLWG